LPCYPKQLDFLQSEARFRAFVGGRGTGKSRIGAVDLIARAKPGRLYLVSAPTYPMLSDATIRSFVSVGEQLGQVNPADVKRQPPSVKLRSGAEVIFRSADDPDRLRGPNLSGAWLDEASLMESAAYDVVIATLREAGELGWLSATFTPRGRLHWTYEVFGTERPDTDLIHARSSENPFLPPEFFETIRRQYGESSALAAQELGGEFVDSGGLMFRRSWFADKYLDNAPEVQRWYRFWDLAATAVKKEGDDPDWTAGAKIGKTPDGRFILADMRRMRGTPLEVERLVKSTAEEDGKAVSVRMEQEPGSSGVSVIDHYARVVLSGWDFRGVKTTGPKEERARPLSAACENGYVYLVRAPWNRHFLDEAESFPIGPHDDQVDAAAGGFNELATQRRLNVFA
jgi:predicted phage terminase large subunit-like protein